ncbi:MAG: hypothetical protein PHI02_04995 [Sulfurovaceae bacterium]|nr:hypothetical protein [Sulfurovaceae bacterium]
MKKLFEATNPSYHPAYNTIVSGKLAKKSKDFYQKLYALYQKNECEEKNFLDGVKKQWYPRIWEMYFTCQLAELGFDISCPKGNAPDIKLKIGDQVIWIECTVISKGKDAVIEHEDGEVHELNDEDYILRITSALNSKYNQIQTHKKSRIIGKNDIVLIAINTGELQLAEIAQTDYPLIHKALYGIGNMEWNVSKDEVKNTQRQKITKKTTEIKTNLFTTKEYKNISGVIFSDWKTIQIEKKLKDDFELTHNLFAKNKLTKGTFKIGIEYLPYESNGVGGFEKVEYNT